MIEEILKLYDEIQPISDSNAVDKISRRLFKELPKSNHMFLNICNKLIRSKNNIAYQVVTTWIKKRKNVYDLKYFKYYERWLIKYTNDWASCDQLCYRVLNPMIERFPELYLNVINWSKSDKTFVKRAAAVCLLQSSQSFKVNVPFSLVKEIVEQLISDKEKYVQKGIGWLLKYSYLTYPQNTIELLNSNVDKMSRLTYRYALEKMQDDIRAKMIIKR